MPSRLPSSLRPMSCMGCHPPHFLSFRSRSPSGARRAEPRISSIAISAVAIVTASGVFAKRWRESADHLRRELLRERDKSGVLALAARDKFVSAHDVIVFVQVKIVIA